MTTRPTDTPEWASAGTITEPPSGKQSVGWLDFEKPPAGAANWAWNRFASWCAHFASTGSAFPTLEGAANAPATAPLVVGDSCLIDEPDGDFPGRVTVSDIDPDGAGGLRQIYSMDAGGDGVLVVSADLLGGNMEINLVNRGGGTEIRNYVATFTADISEGAFYDGVDTVVAYTDGGGLNWVTECWNAQTGASKWTQANMLAIAWDAVHVYCRDGGNNLIAVNRSTGLVAWTFDHGAPVASAASNGLLVFLVGGVSAHASGANMRGIVASNGFDATGEGGLGTDAVLAWDQVVGTPPDAPSGIVTDGRRIYSTLNLSAGAPHDLEIRDCAGGALVTSRTLADNSLALSATDQDFVYVGPIAYDKATLAAAWKTETDQDVIAVDGAAVYTIGNDRVARGNRRPMKFRRVDPSTEDPIPMRQLLIPIDGP